VDGIKRVLSDEEYELLTEDWPLPAAFAYTVWEGLPDLAPAIIEDVLRQGHKMLVAGGSKASKSFALIELAVAIAEGKCWMGWPCKQGRVLYVNLEVDEASCYHRFDAVRKAYGIEQLHAENLQILNMRGTAVSMDLFARWISREDPPVAIIIDPIYKVMAGDENSAQDVRQFTNDLDSIIARLGCAVIYCHHHSKGAQGQKASMDRASGSGVFARDADAILDLIELETGDEPALRVEGTLREFRAFPPRYVWFRYPIHVLDEDGSLKEMRARGERVPRDAVSIEAQKQQRATARRASLEAAFEAVAEDGMATLTALAEYLSATPRATRNWVNQHPDMTVKDSKVSRENVNE
jgi:RecA-family ATPase